MAKIKCGQKDCKYNNCEHCMKEGIYVGENACCDSYEKGKKEDYSKYEFASFERKENKIICNATHCLYNKHKNCIIEHLNIENEKSKNAICADFERENY